MVAPQAQLGYSVAIDGNSLIVGNILAVGAPFASVNGFNNAGAVYFYTRSDSDSPWILRATITASDASENARFGFTVALSNGTLAVGAPGDDGSKGAVYLFTRSGGMSGGMHGGIIDRMHGGINERFDMLRGGAALGGMRDLLRGGMSEVVKITASDGAADDAFGYSVSFDTNSLGVGNVLAVGAPHASVNGINTAGAVYFYTRSDSASSLILRVKITTSDASENALFGSSVFLNNGTLAAGAPGDDGSKGAVYIFSRRGGEVAKLTAGNGAAGVLLGSSVSLDGATLAVGAPRDGEKGDNSGSVSVFTYN